MTGNALALVALLISVGGLLVGWGITVGLFYGHVDECKAFRNDVLKRLTAIEEFLRSAESRHS